MQGDLAAMRRAAMFEKKDSLPRSKRQCAVHDRDREMRLRQRCADMRGHVVGAFRVMAAKLDDFRSRALRAERSLKTTE